jgi:zinc transport system permease protein
MLPLEPFILRALIAGIGVVAIAGILGCFVVWRRMAYFGDSLAHSALLGIALGLLTGLNVSITTVFVCTLFAALMVWLQQKRLLATDTLLGILAHAALSIGLVTISVLGARVDLHAYLFGDILTVTSAEVMWVYGGGFIIILLLCQQWSSLLLMTIHEDLARAESVKTVITHILFMLLMTIMVAISIRIVGILLITSMLIIPAATARQLSRSPEMMACIAALLGVLSVCTGLALSLLYDTPTSPTIVTAAAAMFAVICPLAVLVQRR